MQWQQINEVSIYDNYWQSQLWSDLISFSATLQYCTKHSSNSIWVKVPVDQTFIIDCHSLAVSAHQANWSSIRTLGCRSHLWICVCHCLAAVLWIPERAPAITASKLPAQEQHSCCRGSLWICWYAPGTVSELDVATYSAKFMKLKVIQIPKHDCGFAGMHRQHLYMCREQWTWCSNIFCEIHEAKGHANTKT